MPMTKLRAAVAQDPTNSDAGTIARLVIRVVVMLAAGAGLSIAAVTLGRIEAALEIGLVLATIARAVAHGHTVKFGQIARSVIRPTAVLIAATRYKFTEGDLLALYVSIEAVLAAARSWWNNDSKGA